jgi:hypothetical protein
LVLRLGTGPSGSKPYNNKKGGGDDQKQQEWENKQLKQ